jgi:KTSC domain
MPFVESTAIVRVNYNETVRRLYVTFRESGKTYAYHGVPKTTYEDLLLADSAGAYFNAFVKDRYPFTEGGP